MLRDWFGEFLNRTRPNNFTRTMGKHIREAREERQLSQEELAARIYRRRASLSEMESGKMEPDVSTLVYLAAALQKPILFFFPEPVAERYSTPVSLSPLEQELLVQFRRLENNTQRQVALNQLRVFADINDLPPGPDDQVT